MSNENALAIIEPPYDAYGNGAGVVWLCSHEVMSPTSDTAVTAHQSKYRTYKAHEPNT